MDYDDYDEPSFEDVFANLANDAVFDGLSQDEFAEMAREMWALANRRIEAARNAPAPPPSPPQPFLVLHSRNWLTGEEDEPVIAIQEKPY